MDHRSCPRLDLQLPCVLWRNGDPEKVSGFTANVSRSGALIRFLPEPTERRLPKEGEIVRVEIALAESGRARRRSVSGPATVVRFAAEGDGAILVAVEFGRLEFGQWREQTFEFVRFAGRAKAV